VSSGRKATATTRHEGHLPVVTLRALDHWLAMALHALTHCVLYIFRHL